MSGRRWFTRASAVLAVLLAVVGTGYVIRHAGASTGTLLSTASAPTAKDTVSREAASGAVPGASFGGAAPSASGAARGTSAAAPQAKTASTQQLIVVTASMNVRVKDVLKTVDAIRTATAAAGGTVSEMSVASGPGDTPAPQPLGASSASPSTNPSSANMTLRVPVAALSALQARVASLGDVVSQSSSASDVTQQHVDMAARLKNLRAEEVRLRSLLARAGGVSDLLEVERELSRVRGDIESMQAQLAYLESQAAMATLSVTLAQPGALVRPPAATWGIAEAFTSGVQAAVGLVRAFITGAIALSPIAVLALLGWGVWRLVTLRRRRGAQASQPEAQPEDHPTNAE